MPARRDGVHRLRHRPRAARCGIRHVRRPNHCPGRYSTERVNQLPRQGRQVIPGGFANPRRSAFVPLVAPFPAPNCKPAMASSRTFGRDRRRSSAVSILVRVLLYGDSVVGIDHRERPMGKQPTVADYIVRRLAREGITDCFAVARDFTFRLDVAVARPTSASTPCTRMVRASNDRMPHYARS